MRQPALTIMAIALSCMLFPPIALGGDSTEWKGRVVEREGVQHVVNPSVGMEPGLSVESSEIWRRGGEDDEVLFGIIGDVVRDGNGNTYMLDVQLNTVHHIGPDGDYVGAIGRSGEGPAEFAYPSGLALLSEDILCVTQFLPARAVLITVGGQTAGDHPIPRDDGTPYLKGCAAVNGQLGLYTAQLMERETSVGLQSAFVVVDENGQIVSSYWEQFQKADFANMDFDEKADAEPVWAVGADGRFFVNSDWDSYAVEVIVSEGSPRFVIEREYEHRARTQEEIESIERLKRSGEMASQTKISKTSQDIVKILPRDDGSVWVLSSRGERDVPAGVIASFDAFDKSGRFVRKISLKGTFRPGVDAFHLVGDFVFVVIGGAESGVEAKAALTQQGSADENAVLCLKLAEGL